MSPGFWAARVSAQFAAWSIWRILSRSLGLEDFGHFSLIFGTGQALVAIAGFQTWQAVVRYGSAHIHDGDEAKFGRLVMLCGAIEWIGALTGCLVAFVVFYGFASMLDLNPAYVNMAFAFNCALLWARVSAPTGVLRAVDRFDLSVYVEAVVPTGRLIAATAIWLTGPTIGRFLFAWAAIDLLSAVLYWLTARRASPASLRLRYLSQWRTALAENPGAARFIGIVYAGSALTAVYQQGPFAGGRLLARHQRGRRVPPGRPADAGLRQAFGAGHPCGLSRDNQGARRPGPQPSSAGSWCASAS